MAASMKSQVAGRIDALRSNHHMQAREKPFYEWVSGAQLYSAEDTAALFTKKRHGPTATTLHNLNAILHSEDIKEKRLTAVVALDANGNTYIALMHPRR